MKPTNATLNNILAQREFFSFDLYQITLGTGTILRYAQGQTDIISSDGNLYLNGAVNGPYFDRKDNKAKVIWRLGSGNDQLVIDVIPGNATVQGIPWLSAARAGFFDAADFILYRAFVYPFATTISPGCAVLMFRGRIAEVDCDRSLSSFTINDYRELLNQKLPRNLFASHCVNTLYDASCTVNPASFSANGTVNVGTTANVILTALPQATKFYDGGKVTFTSGQLNGMSYGVSTWVNSPPGVITLVHDMPFIPAVGDTFTAFAGCDRTNGAGGCLKFSNLPNFRGFPYVPPPEQAV